MLPLGNTSSLLACILIGKTKVNAFVDSSVHYISSSIRETAVRSRLRDTWCSSNSLNRNQIPIGNGIGMDVCGSDEQNCEDDYSQLIEV